MKRATDIYVVGCGPSLKGFDWSLLKDRVVVAVNGAVCSIPDAAYAITADSRFATMAVACKFWNATAYRVLVMRNDHATFHRVTPFLHEWNLRIEPSRFDGRIGEKWSEFCTGQNSGFCGMQFAVLLGAKRVHLLGMDFHVNGGEHFHRLYGGNASKLDEFFTHFKTAVVTLKERGVRVISHSQSSRLNPFVESIRLEDWRDG